MRYLLTIPHYYLPTGDRAAHASERTDPRPRISALTACLSKLRTLYGGHGAMLDHINRRVFHANDSRAATLDVVVCTTRGLHLLDQLPAVAGPYEHRPTDAEPLQLGYECHAVLKERLGNYDFYGFLEDDLIATDPWMFQKLAWFNKMAGDETLLQPNRFEYGFKAGVAVRKLYIDGPLNPKYADAFQNRAERPSLNGQVLGCPVRFERPMNPHSGCFFLTQSQMSIWAKRPYFLDRSDAFYKPLESAATLGVLRTFRIYKPAPANADFLEIQHAGTGYFSLLAPDTASGPGDADSLAAASENRPTEPGQTPA